MQTNSCFYLICFILFSCLFFAQKGLASSYRPNINHNRFLQAPVNTSNDVHINTYYTGAQSEAAVTVLQNGQTVITWQSSGQDGSDFGIYARIYSSDTPLGAAEFLVNNYTAGAQGMPSIAAFPGGGFIITWQSNAQDGADYGIFAQRFKADGTKNGLEFQVNTYTTSSQQFPAVTTFSNGAFVIVWQSLGQDGSSYGVYAQRYSAAGTTIGTEFRVNNYTQSAQYYPTIAALVDDSFVITWQSSQDPDGSSGIYAQKYNADGTLNGLEFRVNNYTTSDQSLSVITSLIDGGFVITWQSTGQDGSSSGVYAQRYNADGTRNGLEFRVNTYTQSSQSTAAIASFADGGFIITWQSSNQDSSGLGVFAQIYDKNGVASGSEFQVNTDTFIDQMKPCVTGLGNGYLIVWQSIAMISPELDYGMYAKWFLCPDTTPYLSNNNCYFACPTNALYSYQQGCFSSCPPLAPILYNKECFDACPSEAPYLVNQECSVTDTNTEGSQESQESQEPQEAKVINTQNQVTEISMKVLSVINSNNPNYVFLSNLGSMILYIRYLQIAYPDKVVRMFGSQGRDLISAGLGIGIPKKVENNLNRMLLPEVFEQYDLHSSFLYNLWDSLISFSVILFVTVILVLVEWKTRKATKVHFLFKKLSSIAKWNLPLIVICGNYNNIIFYSILEFTSLDLDSSAKTASFAICLIMLVLSTLIVAMMLAIVINIRKSKTNPSAKRNWNDYTLLHKEFKDDSYSTLTFLVIFCLRILIFDIIITTVFSSPLIQTIVFTCLSVIMLGYLIWKRPMKSKLLLIQLFFNETLLFILNTSVLTLAILDHQNKEALDERNALGEVIIIINILFSSANLFFIGIVLILGFVALYKKIKAARAKGITSFGQTLKFILSEETDEPQSINPSSVVQKDTSITKIETYDSSRLQLVNFQNYNSSTLPKTLSKLESSSYEDLSITKSPDLRLKNYKRSIHQIHIPNLKERTEIADRKGSFNFQEEDISNRISPQKRKIQIIEPVSYINNIETKPKIMSSLKADLGEFYTMKVKRKRTLSEYS